MNNITTKLYWSSFLNFLHMIGKMEKLLTIRLDKCKECKLIKMAIDMRVNGATTLETVVGFKSIKMGRDMMGSGPKANDMAKAGR